MPVRQSACLAAAVLLGGAFATPSAAETFIVNGVLVQGVEGLDRTILDYGENYPPPTPTHSRARFRRSAAVVYYHPPCLFWDGQTTAAVSCRMVPHFVGEPLSYSFR